MKTLIIILIFASFLQTTIVLLDLILIFLICRSYIKYDQLNLYLAFSFGILISFLGLKTFGVQSLIYIITVQITQMLYRSRLAGNPWFIIPLSFLFLSLNQFVNSSFDLGSFKLRIVIMETFLSFPVLYLLRLWEERFIVRKEIKLKL